MVHILFGSLYGANFISRAERGQRCGIMVCIHLNLILTDWNVYENLGDPSFNQKPWTAVNDQKNRYQPPNQRHQLQVPTQLLMYNRRGSVRRGRFLNFRLFGNILRG